MKSPITGNQMTECSEKRTLTYKNESIEIDFAFWRCEESNEQFEDEQQAESNIQQVMRLYAAKNNPS